MREGSGLSFLQAELHALAERGLLREPPREHRAVSPGRRFSSNDYLGYALLPLEPTDSASGAGASRLVWGDCRAHVEAELALAELVGAEAALLFSSGYAANVGALSALAGPGDLVVSDQLNHASIIDGCRLSGAEIVVTPHLDATAVRRALERGRDHRRRFVVTETVFSMDGDVPDLAALRAACDEHGAALIADEAHALGVFGPSGAGQARAAGVQADVVVGTLGKSFGLQGAFVAGAERLRSFLWNRARSFVFSTGVMPAVAELVAARARRLRDDDEGRARLLARAAQLRAGVPGAAPGSVGPIVPLLLGDPGPALRLAAALRAEGFEAQAIRPPTVPPGTARLRLTVTARHTAADVASFVAALRRCS